MKKANTHVKVEVTKVTSWEQLQNAVDAPINCTFTLDKKIFMVEVKRMSPGIAERQRAILRAPQPPYNKDRKDYDPLDPKYLQARDLAEDTARAVVIYFCCPIVAQRKACATDKEIYDLVSGMFTRHIQELIALTAQSGGMNVVEGGNFTQDSGSAG